MKRISKLFLLITFLFNFSVCKKDSAKGYSLPISEDRQKKLDASREELLSSKSTSLKLKGYPSAKSAIVTFLSDLTKNDVANLDKSPTSILSHEEKKKLFFPQIYGYGTALDSTPLDEYMVMIAQMEAIGLQKLRQYKLTKQDLSQVEVKLKEEKVYGDIRVLKVGYILTKGTNRTRELTEIKSIVQIGNQFKVAIVAP